MNSHNLRRPRRIQGCDFVRGTHVAAANDEVVFAPKLPAYKMDDGSPAGDITLTGELAAPPHVVASPEGVAAMVIVTTRDIIKGATVTALTRSFEPPIVPIEPLPNPTMVTPAARPPTGS